MRVLYFGEAYHRRQEALRRFDMTANRARTRLGLWQARVVLTWRLTRIMRKYSIPRH